MLTFSQTGGFGEVGDDLIDWPDFDKPPVGFESFDTYGLSDGGDSLFVFRRKEQGDVRRPFAAVLLISPFTFYAVVVDNEPDLLALLCRLVPLVPSEQLENIHNMLGKFFRATHGHEPNGCCQSCDPYGYERIQEARRRREEKKVSEEKK